MKKTCFFTGLIFLLVAAFWTSVPTGCANIIPPAGGMILAQPVGTDVQNAATSIKINAVKTQVFFMHGKHTEFEDCHL